MASLTSALNYAIAGLSVASASTSLASRNVAGALDPNYTRRTAEIITLPGGLPSAALVSRSADRRLSENLQGALGEEAGQRVILDATARLAQAFGEPGSGGSLPALLSSLQSKLRDLEASPASTLVASEAVAAAGSLAAALNQASVLAQEVRRAADGEIAASVGRIRALLDQFKIANDTIVRGSGTPAELADSLDGRDRILKSLAEEVGIRTISRARNDIAIYTDGGVTLFETVPRKIEFTESPLFTAGTEGSGVIIDGVDVLARRASMGSSTGRLQASARVRDQIARGVQLQLDEAARALVISFSESGQSGTLPPAAGLFTAGPGGAVPPQDEAVPGIASRIRVHELAASNPLLLRDGGFGGAAYAENPNGVPGFQARLARLQGAIGEVRSFAPQAQLGTAMSITDFGASAVGWIAAQRQRANDSWQSASALQTRAREALSRVTGVNIDEEMAAILDLEKSYQASAKIVGVVDAMMAALLEAAG